MRFAKKRFTRRHLPKSTRRKSIGDGNAITRYTNNRYGRAAMLEALAEQRRAQQNLCAKCNQYLPWSESKFIYRECPDGTINTAVHKKCPSSRPDSKPSDNHIGRSVANRI